MGRYIAGADILLCGASYREDVGDTRYSYEIETPDTNPAAGHSPARFFRNEQDLSALRVQKDLVAALASKEAGVFAVRHSPYLQGRSRALGRGTFSGLRKRCGGGGDVQERPSPRYIQGPMEDPRGGRDMMAI